ASGHVAAAPPSTVMNSRRLIIRGLQEAGWSMKCIIVRNCRQEHADAPHPLGLLRPCRYRPCHRRATEQRDELAPLHQALSFDHLSTGEQSRRDFEAERPGRLQVDDELEFC